MADIPSQEPTVIVAGDTVKWTKSLSDYPASSWTLTYYIRGNSISADVVASASGDDYSVTIAMGITAAWGAGDIWMDGYVDNTTERYKVYSAKLTIKPDLSAEDGTYDGRSQAKQDLDAIETAISALIGGAKSFALTVGGNSRAVTSHDLKDLIQQRSILRAEVASEEHAAAIANGLDINPRRIGVRFNRI